MPILLGLVLIVGLIAIVGASTPLSQRPKRLRRPVDQVDTESIGDLAARDPVEALRRYGTPADAARLSQQGVDLGGLGYDAGDGAS